jgi:hypothetical protein
MFKFCNMHVQKFEHACSNFEQHAEIATMLTWDFFQNLMFRVKSHVQSGTCMFHMCVYTQNCSLIPPPCPRSSLAPYHLGNGRDHSTCPSRWQLTEYMTSTLCITKCIDT